MTWEAPHKKPLAPTKVQTFELQVQDIVGPYIPLSCDPITSIMTENKVSTLKDRLIENQRELMDFFT